MASSPVAVHLERGSAPGSLHCAFNRRRLADQSETRNRRNAGRRCGGARR